MDEASRFSEIFFNNFRLHKHASKNAQRETTARYRDESDDLEWGSVNHLFTILVALFGYWIWSTLGIETLFNVSAVIGLCNSAHAATIKVPKKVEV